MPRRNSVADDEMIRNATLLHSRQAAWETRRRSKNMITLSVISNKPMFASSVISHCFAIFRIVSQAIKSFRTISHLGGWVRNSSFRTSIRTSRCMSVPNSISHFFIFRSISYYFALVFRTCISHYFALWAVRLADVGCLVWKFCCCAGLRDRSGDAVALRIVIGV